MASDGKVKPIATPKTDDTEMIAFIKEHGRLALAELKEAFDFTDYKTADEWARKMQKEGLVKINPVGESYFIEPVVIPEVFGGHYCDPTTGECF